MTKKFLSNSNRLFLAAAAFFSLVMAQVGLFADDVSSMRITGSLLTYFDKCVEFWDTWSSRVFINYFVFFFNDDRKLLWAVCMGLTMFLLLWSIKYIAFGASNAGFSLLLCGLVFSFPFAELSTAGWMTTSVTYFFPAALGIYALTLIRKVYDGVKLRKWEYVTYSAAMVYAGNNEQMAVILFGSYLVAAGYFLYRKRNTFIVWWMFVLSVFSFALHLLAPGNDIRSMTEQQYRFQSFDMMNFLDKLELGLSTTVKWLFFENNLFVLLLCLLLTVMIFEKYRSVYYRFLSLIPITIVACYSVFYDAFSGFYKWTDKLNEGISQYGMIAPSNVWEKDTFLQFVLFAGLVAVVVIEIFLLLDTVEEALAVFTLLLFSVASRVAIGFSPTIYASGNRTGVIMAFGLIVMAFLLVQRHIARQRSKGCVSVLESNSARLVYLLLILFGCLNLVYIAA